MAKTLLNLITEAANLADEQGIANAQWVEWLNNGLVDIAPVLRIDDKATITKNPDGVFPLPADYISTIRLDGVTKNLVLLTEYDDESTGYHIVAGNIELQNDDADSVTLWYYKSPTAFDTSTASATMDTKIENCSRALVFFACAMCMLQDDETERYGNYMSEYTKAKAIIASRQAIRRPARSGEWGVIR